MTEEDPIRRASRLGPPSVAEVALLHLLLVLVAEKPKRLERLLARARDKAAAAKVRRLHEAENDGQWEEAFAMAAIRLESVAAMIRKDMPAKPKKKRR
jgi:hypothetical protein